MVGECPVENQILSELEIWILFKVTLNLITASPAKHGHLCVAFGLSCLSVSLPTAPTQCWHTAMLSKQAWNTHVDIASGEMAGDRKDSMDLKG